MIYKILLKRYNPIGVFLFFFHFQPTMAQQVVLSPYGVPVLNSIADYRQSVSLDPGKKMILLEQLIPDLVYDLRYASDNNFMHRRMYRKNTKQSFLRSAPAIALQKAANELRGKGYAIKVFDAYRPYAVTVKFWELIKDERYVANPSKGSGHNRGLAIDMTIINLKTSKELDMGTGFDNFTDTAHQDFTQLPEEVLLNRQLLKDTMVKYGFRIFETEWWHYYWPNDRDYEVLDIDFNELIRENRNSKN